jgi:hypothetical protein
MEGPLKIGYSASPQARLHGLQVGTTEYLHLHYREEVQADHAKIIEQLVHRQLGHKRIRGEWFDVSLQDAISEIKFAIIRWDSEPNLIFRFKRRLL